MRSIKVDFVAKTITISKSFYEASQDCTSTEYAELKKIKSENPDMTITVRSYSKSHPNACKGLTYRYMRRFIQIFDTKNLETYANIIKYYEDLDYDSATIYREVKNWFLEYYPRHKEMIADAAPHKKTKIAA